MHLLDLPAELLEKILDVVARAPKWKRTIGQLALSHRDLLSVCQRRLFSSVTLARKDRQSVRQPHGYIARESFAPVAAYIRHLHIYLDWAFMSKGQWIWPMKEDKILLKVIEACPNLQGLTVTWPGGVFLQDRLELWDKALAARGLKGKLGEVRSNKGFHPVLMMRAPQEWTLDLSRTVIMHKNSGASFGEIVAALSR